MLTKTNEVMKNTEVKSEVNLMDASMDMLNELKAEKGYVKPTLTAEGYYTVKFTGIKFIETVHKSTKVMAMTINYSFENKDYEEMLPMYAETPEQRAAVLGQIKRYRDQIAEQFNLIGQAFDIQDLNNYIGQNIDIKIYTKEFTKINPLTNKEVTGHARKFGFWKKPEQLPEVAVTTTEVPKF